MKTLARKLIPQKWHWSYYCPRYLNVLVKKRTKQRIYSGPFQQMHYLDHSLASVYLPKLLGIYEQELHDVIEEAIALNASHVIDIGAAEGYYAVGLALRLPNASITAFEMEISGQQSIMELAKLNGVEDRINVLGKCERKDLKRVLSQNPRALIVCDVEGYEDKLLDPEEVPELCAVHILVELHDFVERGLTEKIKKRFLNTHDIEHIWQRDREVFEFPFPTFQTCIFPSAYIANELTEFRPERMSWFWMVPKGSLI